MYFSRVRVDTVVATQMNLLKILQGDVYAIHQLVWKLFPEQPSSKRDFIYRQEFEKEQLPIGNARRGMPLFYIVSKNHPRSVPGLLSVEAKEYSPILKVGSRLAFVLRVNPIVARRVGQREKSSKHDILMDAKIEAKRKGVTDPGEIERLIQFRVTEWVSRKGQNAGYFLAEDCDMQITSYRQNLLRKRGKHRIQFSSVDISGVLVVKEPKLFIKQSLFKGLGHSKSFGCGMMMVRRV